MSNRYIRQILLFAIVVGITSMISTCSQRHLNEPAEYRAATQITLDWNRMLLELERYTDGYRPPVSARMFAYAEMAAYEAALPGMQGYVSMEEYVVGYHKLPVSQEHFNLPAALNASYAYIARAFFPTAPNELQDKITRLEAKYQSSKNPDEATQESIDFGKKTAAAVWRFSVQDSIGHDAFMYNYDRNFKVEGCKGCWKSEDERSIPPLLPHWGHVRSFVVSPESVESKPPIPFDETAASAFYAEALEIYSISHSLSAEERWIAEFWSDDLPGLTITPTGRWFSIANQAIENSELSFPVIMETYLKVGLALCDASIVCWENKYRYQVERPDMFIHRNIQSDWVPFHHTPPFPSYPSGHSIFGAAAAEVLTSTFGPEFYFVDRTHQGRQEFAGAPRAFNSFDEMANENAYSRVLIGVHFRMDCEEGLRLGKIIGQKVSAVSLRKEQVAVLRPK